MTAAPLEATWNRRAPVPAIVAGLAFLVLYAQPLSSLVSQWWSDPDAGHGLLLAPLALWLAWRRGRAPGAAPQPVLGLVLLGGAVLLRYLSGLAAELYTMRVSAFGAALGLVVFTAGLRQVLHWWLPAALIFLSIPLPVVVVGTLALPLQLKASQMGAWLLHARSVPVELAGNVIHMPGRSLFVTEACSGLRSLTSLVALGVLVGGLWLKRPWLRALLVLAAIPVAMFLNGIRVFLTGFIVHYIDPALADGFMHYTEGWVIFVAAFAILGAMAWVMVKLESRLRRGAAA
jgi:exosortase